MARGEKSTTRAPQQVRSLVPPRHSWRGGSCGSGTTQGGEVRPRRFRSPRRPEIRILGTPAEKGIPMGISDSLKKAGWSIRVVARALSSSGALGEMTLAGAKTAVQGALTRRLGPSGAVAIHAANHPHREALIDRRRRVTYRQMVEETFALSNALSHRG